MDVELGSRLRIISGDNGLGKSCLLDLCWFGLTRQWPAEVNPRLMSGFMAEPSNKQATGDAAIEYVVSEKVRGNTTGATIHDALNRQGIDLLATPVEGFPWFK